MEVSEQRAQRRVTVSLRIKLRYQTLDAFISKFATNLSVGGMFINSKAPKPVGTELRFELRLADNSPIIAGRGVVRWTRKYDAKAPRQPHGMGVQFIQLSANSKKLIQRVVDHKAAQGDPNAHAASIPHTPAGDAPSSDVAKTATVAENAQENSAPKQPAVATQSAPGAKGPLDAREPNLETALRRARALTNTLGDDDFDRTLSELRAPTPMPTLSIDQVSSALDKLAVPTHAQALTEPTAPHVLEGAAEEESAESAESNDAATEFREDPTLANARGLEAWHNDESNGRSADIQASLAGAADDREPATEDREPAAEDREPVTDETTTNDLEPITNDLEPMAEERTPVSNEAVGESLESIDLDDFVAELADDDLEEVEPQPIQDDIGSLDVTNPLEVSAPESEITTDDLSKDLAAAALDPEGLIASDFAELGSDTDHPPMAEGTPDLASFADPPDADIQALRSTATQPAPIDDGLDGFVAEIPPGDFAAATAAQAESAETNGKKKGFFKRIFRGKKE